MSEQLELGELWEDASGIVSCSCAAGGPVLMSDRRILCGLIERVTRCKACDARQTWRMSAPQPKPQRPAPLLSTMERGR